MKVRACFLILLGLMQMTGDILNIPPLKAVGFGTCASPAPKVFSSVESYETFSVRFVLEWQDKVGKSHQKEITSEMYSQVKGPYNRRNTFGAILAYGPVFSTNPRMQPLYTSVVKYALSGKAPLLREIGIDPDEVEGAVSVKLIPTAREYNKDLPLIVEVAN